MLQGFDDQSGRSSDGTTKIEKKVATTISALILLLIVLPMAYCHFESIEILKGEEARSAIHYHGGIKVPPNATDLYIIKKSPWIDSESFIGMTLPREDGMQFMQGLANSNSIKEGFPEGWIERDFGPQDFGFWYRTDHWNLEKMKKTIHCGGYVYDQESGRLLFHNFRH